MRIDYLIAVLAVCTWASMAIAAENAAPAVGGGAGDIRAPLPVILDTDIGDDIDDTWALGLLLKSPEVDLKLVVGDYYKAPYRAKVIAKFLTAAGRTDVGVGIGLRPDDKGVGGQAKWVEGYDLKSYAGKVHQDGVQALIDTIMNSPRPVTLVAIGPVPNLAEALKRKPEIATKARFVGMHGSVRLGYGGSKTLSAEWNVKADAKSCQKVFTARWDMTITPLDTCGLVHVRGQKYQQMLESKDPVAMTVIANYRIWAEAGKNAGAADKASSTLFDTVAAYLSFSNDLLVMEKLNIRVTDDGFTRIDPEAKSMNVATEWKDIGAFEDLLVKRLTSPR